MKGFLKTAHDYICTDAAVPTQFGQWAAHITLSHILGCSAWTSYGGHKDIFSKWMVILIGQPGTYKSMTLKWANDFIKHMDLPQLPRKCSSAKLFQRIERIRNDPDHLLWTSPGPDGGKIQWANVLFVNGEMSESFELAAQDLVNQLNALFDFEETTYDTIAQGEHKIEPLHFNAIWGCQPSWAKKLGKDVLFDGGFMRRVIASYPDPIPYFKSGPRNQELLKKGIAELEYIKNRPAIKHVPWTPNAEIRFDRYVEKHVTELQKLTDEKLLILWTDHHVFVARAALNYAISENPNNPTIDVHHLDLAIRLIDQVKIDEQKLLREGGVSETHQIYVDASTFLEKKKTVSSDDLFKLFGRDTDPKAYRFAMAELQRATFVKFEDGFYKWTKTEDYVPVEDDYHYPADEYIPTDE